MQILIADDDFIALELLRNALEESGFEVTTARDGREALDLFERGRFRLVITDWEMPRMTGLELCRAVRERSDHGYVYQILLTSHATSEDIVEGMSAGADDFIVKPFKMAELLVRVRAGQRILSLETRELVIFAMAKLAESRDPETGKHLERVQRYARLLCLQLAHESKYSSEIDHEFIRHVYQTSPLHDIGKVGIPDTVLLKPGRLSDDQFEIMKTHTLIGAETLDARAAAESECEVSASCPRHRAEPPRTVRRPRLPEQIRWRRDSACGANRGAGRCLRRARLRSGCTRRRTAIWSAHRA